MHGKRFKIIQVIMTYFSLKLPCRLILGQMTKAKQTFFAKTYCARKCNFVCYSTSHSVRPSFFLSFLPFLIPSIHTSILPLFCPAFNASSLRSFLLFHRPVYLTSCRPSCLTSFLFTLLLCV